MPVDDDEQALEDGYARLAMSRREDRAERRTIRDRALERTEPVSG